MHDEVFVMSTFYTQERKVKHYYHKMLEALPRIVPYLEFLKRHPLIRIHAGAASGIVPELLKMPLTFFKAE